MHIEWLQTSSILHIVNMISVKDHYDRIYITYLFHTNKSDAHVSVSVQLALAANTVSVSDQVI